MHRQVSFGSRDVTRFLPVHLDDALRDPYGLAICTRTHFIRIPTCVSAEVDGELCATNDLTPVEEVSMRAITHTTLRAAVAIGTMVALIATVGAPFKWSSIISPPW